VIVVSPSDPVTRTHSFAASTTTRTPPNAIMEGVAGVAWRACPSASLNTPAFTLNLMSSVSDPFALSRYTNVPQKQQPLRHRQRGCCGVHQAQRRGTTSSRRS
jgi:hypothetical protein